MLHDLFEPEEWVIPEDLCRRCLSAMTRLPRGYWTCEACFPPKQDVPDYSEVTARHAARKARKARGSTRWV